MDAKILPHNLSAEESALGAMILSKKAITTSIEYLKEEDFYVDAHKKIYMAILNLYRRNSEVDYITLTDELTRMDLLEEIGGLEYIANLSSAVTAISNAREHYQIIKEKSILRKLIETSEDLLEKSFSKDAQAKSILEIAEKQIFDIAMQKDKKDLVPIREVLMDTFEQIEKRSLNPNALTGLSSGFVDLDKKLSGLQKSDLILIAARPSMGKTAFMVNIATNVALKEKKKVAIFSLEMSKVQLVQRIISSVNHIDLQNIISGNINPDEWKKVVNSLNPISMANIEIDDTASISPLEIKAKAKRLMIEKGLDLIVIDYLQLMQMDRRTENRQQEISAISRALKALAKELEIPVIALSQLSRSPESRTDKRPILSDLRESGAIEQDADVVMFLYRDDYYNRENSEKPNTGEVIISKHRNGPTGVVELTFLKQFTKFIDKSFE